MFTVFGFAVTKSVFVKVSYARIFPDEAASTTAAWVTVPQSEVAAGKVIAAVLLACEVPDPAIVQATL